MQRPFCLTRIAFPAPPTTSNHDLILQALSGWGDPEQLTDAEATELKSLCIKWFKLTPATIPHLQARLWKDAIVFSTRDDPGAEHAIILQSKIRDEDRILLYIVNRGHRLIPAEHSSLQYLKHVVDAAVDEYLCVE
jgi:hypothetical protein